MDLDFGSFIQDVNRPPGQQKPEEPGLRPHFHLRAMENPSKSRVAGRPIYDELEYVEIAFIADKSTVVVERVNDKHRERWPAAYAAFKAGRDQATSGTPLEQWPPLGMGRVAELKALKIHTVEELAGLTDAGMMRLGMGARELVQQAKAYIDKAAGLAPLTALQGENAALRAQLDAQAKQMADLLARVDKLAPKEDEAPYVDEPTSAYAETMPERRGPGRPRKYG